MRCNLTSIIKKDFLNQIIWEVSSYMWPSSWCIN